MSVEDNREAQRKAYGEPLADIFGRIRDAFGLNQSALAGVLGLSAPMLSQLNSAQRVKIGNPAVLQRVQSLEDLVREVGAGAVDPSVVPERLEEIKASTGGFTRTTSMVPSEAPDEAVVASIRNLLRAVASGQQVRAAAEELEPTQPELAEVLRIYGTGPLRPAQEHYAKHKDLF